MIREFKGNSEISLLDSFVVIDIETTGLDPEYDEIIELGAFKVKEGKITETFSKLVKPKYEISEFITQLTGITNEMVANEPSIEVVLPQFLSFISDYKVVGHNINFDINFIYDNSIRFLNTPFKNDFVDTLRLCRRLYPQLSSHRLQFMCDYLDLKPTGSHRALLDCETTYKLYEHIKSYIIANNIDLTELFKPKRSQKLSAKDIVAVNDEFDESNPLYDKHCVFTGTLSIPRREAMQKVVDVGGVCEDSVTQKTNFLILGNLDYNKCKGSKSSKMKKAEKLILSGQDLEIISENVFFDMLQDRQNSTEMLNKLKDYINDKNGNLKNANSN